MPTEAEKRLHRCSFSGQRPEKLDEPEETVKEWLAAQIDDSVRAGFRTFLCGMGMGVDIWAGQIVAERRKKNPELRLICAVPWPGFSNRWNVEWQEQYSALLREADLVVPVSHQYSQDVFRKRNEWLINHSSRLIAYYNGEPGGTKDTVEYALGQNVRVFTNISAFPDGDGKMRETVLPGVQRFSGFPVKPSGKNSRKQAYPESILTAIGAEKVFGTEEYAALTPDQEAGLEHILGLLPEREQEILRLRYREGKTLEECGKPFGVTRQRALQIEQRALRKLRHPSRTMFIRDGFEKAELALKITCAEEIKRCLAQQKNRYPRMNEEDVVKLVFQGMLGPGHMIASEADALVRLREEMDALEPDMEEPLAEKISTYWLRINLRAAKARQKSAEELAYMLFRSAQMRPLSFTRQNVYNFCVKMDGSEKMKTAAEKVLDENWLPRHSEQYREAYLPAYRVMHRDYRKFRREEEDGDSAGNDP